MKKKSLKIFFEEYIAGTAEKAIVANKKILLCDLTYAVTRGIEIDAKDKSVHLSSKVFKHLYDKKPAEEFNFLIDYLDEIVRYPDKVYKNKESKRGGFCFIKKIKDFEYLCSLEITKIPPATFGVACFGVSKFGQKKEIVEINIVTAFRIRDDNYLKNYTLLWDWGNGNPHRSALDTP